MSTGNAQPTTALRTVCPVVRYLLRTKARPVRMNGPAISRPKIPRNVDRLALAIQLTSM